MTKSIDGDVSDAEIIASHSIYVSRVLMTMYRNPIFCGMLCIDRYNDGVVFMPMNEFPQTYDGSTSAVHLSSVSPKTVQK